MASRAKQIESVDTPINPIYVSHWFGAVSVADAINSVFERIFDRGLQLATRRGESTIIIPEKWEDCSRNMLAFLDVKIKQLRMMAIQANRKYNCTIYVDKCARTSRGVELHQCAFHLDDFDKNIGDIPTHWLDNEDDYTWAQVCQDGQYYSSSSSETWPRPEYVRFARLEKMRAARLERVDPFSRYYAAANRN